MECKINEFELVKEILFKPVDKSKITQIEDEIKIIDELIKKHMEKATDSSLSHEAYLDEYESLVKEGKFIYQIIKLKKGHKRYSKKDLFFGPYLLENKDKLFNEYYDRELKSREILIKVLPKNYRIKKLIIKKEIKLIKSVL